MVQHMPESFTKSYAARLNQLCEIEVREAKDGDRVLPGLALLAPGNFHMKLVRDGAVYCVQLDQEPREHYQRPAVDHLFHSVAETAGPNAVAVLLTGMGKDGALGLSSIKMSGGRTIAQDEQSCIVFGMPAEAIKIGAAEFVLPLEKIATHALRLVESATL